MTIRLGLVTAYPPSQTTLNEYGHHLARHLAAKPEVEEVLLFCDEVAPDDSAFDDTAPDETALDDEGRTTPPAVTAAPCWRYGSWANPFRILLAVRKHRPDAVLVNAHFTSFGSGKVAATLGLLLPLLLRLAGVPTIVLLHNLVETVDLETAGFSSHPMVTRALAAAGRLVTRLVLVADRIAVTIPQYVEILRDAYGADHVFLAPHGSFDEPAPPAPKPDHGPSRILAFGKWGTYKRVDELLEAQRLLRERGHDTEIVVAGTDSHNAVGYLDDVRERFAHVPGVRFTGYVAEEDVPRVFTEATIAVFPYTSTTGSSGVLHQAGSYGCPVVLPEIGDFAELVAEEGFEAATFEPGDARHLADALEGLLRDPGRRGEMGAANWAAACGIPLADVADWHLLHLCDVAGTGRRGAVPVAGRA